MRITDCHVHIQPWSMVKPQQLALLRAHRNDADYIQSLMEEPRAFLSHLDAAGVERAVLINYVSDLMGFTEEVNGFVLRYCGADRTRLIACGSLRLNGERAPNGVRTELERLIDAGLQLVKIHPPHQMIYPNDYTRGNEALATVYRVLERRGVPVMIHTGTSIFPGARNKFGDPMFVDDVAVDFPKLRILLAHGGRPLWTETAFFLIRRHSNVYFDLSGIPPQSLLKSFPRLEQIAHKTLFGTDWPGPGVPGIAENVQRFRSLPISEEAKTRILEGTAIEVFG